MWWRRLLLLIVAASAAEEEHFLDVKQIVKGTIEAVAKLPQVAHQNTSEAEGSEKEPEEFYKLFQLPADIMTKLAADAGYIESPTTTTNGPWIVRRKVHKSSEDEQSFTQDESKEEEEPRRKKKHRKNKDPTLISISDILSRVEQSSSPTTLASLDSNSPAARSPAVSSSNTPSLPVVQSSTDLSHSHVQPQYAYQPIVQPDGKTYYQQVLILPGQVVSSGALSGLRQPLPEKSAFVQERPLQPKNVVQADYSIVAPTFPPPVDIFGRRPVSQSSNPTSEEPGTKPSLYPIRYVKPRTSAVPQQDPLPASVRLPQSDPIAIQSPRHGHSVDEEPRFTPRETLYTTRMPTFDEQRRSARIFREEASAPSNHITRITQESPLRIRTIDSHIERESSAEMNAVRLLKKKEKEELKKELDRHRIEFEPPVRNRKSRKVKKTKKSSKKYVEEEEDAPSTQATSEELRDTIRRMPEAQYLKRVPLLTSPALRRHERVHGSKTWKRKYEPMEESVSKGLESLEDKMSSEEEVTEPPKKKRKSRKSSKPRKMRYMMEESEKQMRGDKEWERSKEMTQEESQQMDEEVKTTTPMPLRRKTIRLYRVHGVRSNNLENDDEHTAVAKKHRSRLRKVRKTKRSRKTETPSKMRSSHFSSSSDSFPQRQHCLNIRTFAKQFGSNDVEEFTQEHCAFIENYYPELTCEKRSHYMAECQKYF